MTSAIALIRVRLDSGGYTDSKVSQLGADQIHVVINGADNIE